MKVSAPSKASGQLFAETGERLWKNFSSRQHGKFEQLALQINQKYYPEWVAVPVTFRQHALIKFRCFYERLVFVAVVMTLPLYLFMTCKGFIIKCLGFCCFSKDFIAYSNFLKHHFRTNPTKYENNLEKKNILEKSVLSMATQVWESQRRVERKLSCKQLSLQNNRPIFSCFLHKLINTYAHAGKNLSTRRKWVIKIWSRKSFLLVVFPLSRCWGVSSRDY